jgi:hypothetical protein
LITMFAPLLLSLTLAQAAPPAAASGPPLLVVLAETGQEREGLPVYTRHPDAARYEAVLTRGLAGRMLRIYRWEQTFLVGRDGGAIEPAYLLMSGNQGGFPRFGFWLDGERKAKAGYVDLYRDSDLTGRYGAIDQIFPHELAHVMVQQLAGPAPDGPANQVHAIGVRTDRLTAFNEGFAEHFQILAIDDPGAAPETRALGADTTVLTTFRTRLEAYRRALEARWSIAPRALMVFPFWYSQGEQSSRYHDVKANRYAHRAEISERVLARSDLHAAYLLENVLPGAPDDPLKPTARLLESEGAVASLFWRWATDDEIGRRYREPAFYARFGVTPGEVPPLENAELKIFAAVAAGAAHDTASLVGAYVTAFPDEAPLVARVLRDRGFGWPLDPPPEIWLANNGFRTGTSLFDQFRAMPRRHTFDLNAASLVDLLTVEGMTRAAAEAILDHAPYASLDALSSVPEVSPALRARFTAMAAAMGRTDTNAMEHGMSLMTLMKPYLYRAVAWLLVCALAGGAIYRGVRKVWWPRLVMNGLGVALAGLAAAWLFVPQAWVGWAPWAPIALFGLPGAAWRLARTRSGQEAGRVLAAWALACLPVWLVVTPLS